MTDDPIQPVQLTAIVELCPTIVNQFVELCPSLWKASLVALQEFKAQTRFSLLSGMHKELLKINCFLQFLAMLHGMWDLSSLARD